MVDSFADVDVQSGVAVLQHDLLVNVLATFLRGHLHKRVPE